MTKRLLVIDDAAIIRAMVRDAAEADGWTVVAEAANGQQGIERYQELKPDVVTLDLVMPEFDGLHALRGIMALDPDARVLVVSALEQKAILKEAFKAGAADFLVKPFEKKVLSETLAQLVPMEAGAA